MNSDSTSESAIGTLISFRTVAGWLISTVRLDCPWLAWFSYNGKLPDNTAVGVAGGLAGTSNGTVIVNGRRRRLFASANGNGNQATTTTVCPSLTTNGSIMYGSGNGQYQNGRPDTRSTLGITYTGTRGRVVEVIPMYRYQNNGDGSNNNEDNGGDGWYSCYTFMHQMKNISTTCEAVRDGKVQLSLPLVFKVVSDGSRCSVTSVQTTAKTPPSTPPSCTADTCTVPTASPPLELPLPSPVHDPSALPAPSTPLPPISPTPAFPTHPDSDLTDDDGNGHCYPKYDAAGNLISKMCVYIAIPSDSAVQVDPTGNIVTSSGVNNTDDVAKRDHLDGSFKDTEVHASLPPPSLPPTPSTSSPPASSLLPTSPRGGARPVVEFDTGEDDPERNWDRPVLLPDNRGGSYGIDSAALAGNGTYTERASSCSDTCVGGQEGLIEGGSGRDLPIALDAGASDPSSVASPLPHVPFMPLPPDWTSPPPTLLSPSVQSPIPPSSSLPSYPPFAPLTPLPPPYPPSAPPTSPPPSYPPSTHPPILPPVYPPSASPSPSPASAVCECPAIASPQGTCAHAAGTVPLFWFSRQKDRVVAVQCVDAPTIDATTGALVLPICWRRSCVVEDGSLASDDLDLTLANVSLPAPFQQSSVGVALTLLKPSCALEAWAEGNPVDDRYNTLLFNEANTVTTPGGGLASCAAHVTAPAMCDDTSAVFMLNAMAVALRETVYNQCPFHAIPDTANGNADCPAGKVMVFLEVTDKDWRKLDSFATVKQCVDPANYDMFGGEMAISYCWSFGQLPDQFTYLPFRVRMPNVTEYNIQRMPGGSWRTLVNRPANPGLQVTLTVNPLLANGPKVVVTQSGDYTLAGTGVYSVDLEILVPNGLDDQSVSVQMFGPPNPPPPSEICPCPTALPADGVCPGTTAMLTASLVTNTSVTQRGCVPSPYWDGSKGELMFSHCWRYLCLGSAFQKQDYFLDLEFTDKYNVASVPAGEHRLDWFKPKVVDMFLSFKYNSDRTTNPTNVAQYSSRNGQSQTITVPPGGISQMSMRFKVPFNMIYDANSGSVNLNTDPQRLVPPPPPPLALTNYSYTVNRTGSILRSQIFVTGLANASMLNFSAMAAFSSDIQGAVGSYIMNTEVSFPDYSLVKSCTPSDVQAVLNTIAKQRGVSPDTLSASCEYNYRRPNTTAQLTTVRHHRSLQQAGVVCRPRITIAVTMPLGGVKVVNGSDGTVAAAASQAANDVFAAVGGDACYVPTGAESTVGTTVSFATPNRKATCDYLLQAFAASNNLTADTVRTLSCESSGPLGVGELGVGSSEKQDAVPDPKKKVSGGMIALFTVIGVVGLALVAVLSLSMEHADTPSRRAAVPFVRDTRHVMANRVWPIME
ncbi:hypothetical protein TSOC_010972 [Tetrabaena socialis]|uniref:Uncharacterized protein n=1 Tax=Tetrabaena socialis TaxID=47790 RepID=A0A2J7ZS01_9CHLO|nr:hypothetical protein TSOC_010972 [Tetrabaena socialis]|eukprot:PNH03010.1 hypothetical protein TSOC_010972 [Tetrabaena socialis]